MSDAIKHECGIAMVRLLKPLSYYKEKYGTWRYGINKMYILMEKQHNRGQDGAGLVNLKIDLPPGKQYINRVRSNSNAPIIDIFKEINAPYIELQNNGNLTNLENPEWAKQNLKFSGELFLGHLRYGTFGGNDIEHVHPLLRENNWKTRTLALAGNFNLTNVDELINKLIELGQHPKDYSDTVTVMENLGHFLDHEVQRLFEYFHMENYTNKEITQLIANQMDVAHILRGATKHWDGGYVIGGLIGHGDAFVLRDENGIRPAFWYQDDEVVVVASERPVIQTAFNLPATVVHELTPGHALIIKKNGETTETPIKTSEKINSCSFERIYFSRGSDIDIYNERKKLGELLVPEITQAIDEDLNHSVFSYIPNTAETAFLGMVKGLENFSSLKKAEQLIHEKDNLTTEKITRIINTRPRVEKIAIKDAKMRTFISQDNQRDDLVAHIYDITYGCITPHKDNLVVIDDSIVRGTTLRESIINILDRLEPKKIIIVSSAPQIRYPDCYGIDMARLDDLIAFRAAIELLHETNQSHIIDEVEALCRAQEHLPKEDIVNHVKKIYEPFTAHELSDKIGKMLTLPHIKSEVKIIFQSIENLHKAIPKHNGDWYFTGNYPTPGGNRVVNRAFLNFIDHKKERAY